MIAKAARAGDLGRWAVLVNAGTEDTANGKEDWTIPEWMLPAKYGKPGARLFPDKIDICLVQGWEPDTVIPTIRAEKAKITLRFVESTSSHDFYLKSVRNGKRSNEVC